MLEHTLDRARKVVDPQRIVTVVGRGHRAFLSSQIPGLVIEQPHNRDTVPGIFLPATYIMAADPSATVFIFPSDHFVFPEEQFLAHVLRAGLLARALQDRLVLLGARPDCPEPDYGWIEPGAVKKAWAWSSREGARDVLSFQEKPSAGGGEKFFGLGYLWNTMIMAVQIRTLWALGQKFFPAMMNRFETLGGVLKAIQQGRVGEEHEQIALSHIYREMPSANFSRDLLQRAAKQAVVLPMTDVEWSDWGRPGRVLESLDRLGKRPNFAAVSCYETHSSVA
jgi:mannose-1-phosphate guanylyltransferase